jgi:AraC-like DNA-binding protein
MCSTPWQRARTEASRLRDLARLRQVRDRIDRELAQPVDLEELAQVVQMSAAGLAHQFVLAFGESPDAYRTARRAERALMPAPADCGLRP